MWKIIACFILLGLLLWACASQRQATLDDNAHHQELWESQTISDYHYVLNITETRFPVEDQHKRFPPEPRLPAVRIEVVDGKLAAIEYVATGETIPHFQTAYTYSE